ncbi:branched-chain amino acid ABC transporter permease [Bradyrhizobium sp.]|jgi:branched-chain amino acid transport system permease protein|uniref:branched-chain amino acid ABC transporter permease n=1 Tax=Bradyrhizobium sp. TaxID=376 RepID=UPI003C1CF38F
MDVPSAKPVPTFRIETSASLVPTIIIGGVLLAAALLPLIANRDLIQNLIFLFYMMALAQCWNLLAGYAGLISVGQQAFVGLGGYLLFALTLPGGINPLIAIPIVGLISGALALPTALIVFRLRGAYFAIGTWVVAEVYRLVFAQFRALGGGTGTSLDPSVTSSVPGIEWIKALMNIRTPAARDIVSYWLVLALMAGTLVLAYCMLRSRRGLALGAIRDNELAAAGLGVDIYRIRLGVYVATAAMTGMIGAMIYLQKARISPDAAFSVLDWTAYVIFMTVIGGIGTIEGPMVGAVVFYLMQRYLADFGAWYLIVLGALGIFVMLFAPKGIWGFVSERYHVTLFPTRRRLVIHANDSNGR